MHFHRVDARVAHSEATAVGQFHRGRVILRRIISSRRAIYYVREIEGLVEKLRVCPAGNFEDSGGPTAVSLDKAAKTKESVTEFAHAGSE